MQHAVTPPFTAAELPGLCYCCCCLPSPLQAVAAYLAKVSGPTEGDFFTTFFGKLISYHIVARW